MKLIYGLGNPGEQYKYTRHNIGFLVADFLAQKWRISLKKASRDVASGKGMIMRIPVTIAKPLTYMNLSGMPL
jgi:PTH1 family peptidyl-tRNA hydrolase